MGGATCSLCHSMKFSTLIIAPIFALLKLLRGKCLILACVHLDSQWYQIQLASAVWTLKLFSSVSGSSQPEESQHWNSFLTGRSAKEWGRNWKREHNERANMLKQSRTKIGGKETKLMLSYYWMRGFWSWHQLQIPLTQDRAIACWADKNAPFRS